MDRGIEGTVRDLARQADPEDLQQAAQLVLQIYTLAENSSATGEQQSYLVALQTLYMDTAVPTSSQDLRDAARVIAISLVAHRCQRSADLARLEADNVEPGCLQSISQVLRER